MKLISDENLIEKKFFSRIGQQCLTATAEVDYKSF